MIIKTKKGIGSPKVELIGQTKAKELVYRVTEEDLARLVANHSHLEYEVMQPSETYIKYHAARAGDEFAGHMAERAMLRIAGLT